MTHSNPNKFTLGQLAKRVGLARTSVLHYESLGLLTPVGRSSAGYRLYGKPELDRLLNIRRLRDSGLPLADIGLLLSPSQVPGTQGGAGARAILEKRLLVLCQEVGRLQEQQRHLARLLVVHDVRKGQPSWNKDGWVALLRRAGFNDEAMHVWHIEFERDDPEGHANFLKLLGFKPAAVAKVRRWSRLKT